MIINRTHNFIFIHVPKTAGTSVSRHLSKFTSTGDLDINRPLTEFAEYHCQKYGLRKHTSANEVRDFLGAEDFQAAFKFGFVRNPYLRLFSLYNFLKYNWRRWPGSDVMDTLDSYAEFVKSDFFWAAHPLSVERDSIQRLCASQVFWLCDENGRVSLDFVGKVEQLEKDFDQICSRIGLPTSDDSLERANVSARSAPRIGLKSRLMFALGLRSDPRRIAAHSPESLEDAYQGGDTQRIVAERFAIDFDTFGYSRSLAF